MEGISIRLDTVGETEPSPEESADDPEAKCGYLELGISNGSSMPVTTDGQTGYDS